MAHYWIIKALPLLAVVIKAESDWLSSSTSIVWWPAPPFTTLSAESGPVSAHRSKPPISTSLTGIPSYTYTSTPKLSFSDSATSSKAPFSNSTSTALPISTSSGPLPACKSIQHDFPAGSGGNAQRAAAVQEAYVFGWDAYTKYAFGKDELQPLNASGMNDWYGM